MSEWKLRLVIMAFWCALSYSVQAGGSGLNVVVIVNQNSTNSVQLGNNFCELRNVPPQNLLRINWTGGNIEWALSDFTNALLNPFLTMLSARQLTNQIDYVVLSMDIPYRVNGGTNGENSTTSALFYGFINITAAECELAAGSSNAYAGSEGIFRSTPPVNAASNFFLVTMLTQDSLTDAETVVHQGVVSDGTFPTNTAWLGKSDDIFRNIRYPEFDNTVFNTRLRGNYNAARTNIDSPTFNNLILGYENGISTFYTYPNPLFVPGAMADNLTSFGGQLFENPGQTTALSFLSAGAAGSYGTVTEPCNYQQKYPDSEIYFYQARGFSLAECYYLGLTNPYQGLVLGEPLAAPFALNGLGSWTGISNYTVLSGSPQIAGQFVAADAQHPLQQVDFFLDGTWAQTITNVVPKAGNVLYVTINGTTTSYTVPTGATIKTVTSNLYNALNATAYRNATKTTPALHGDRIEFQSTAAYTVKGSQISLAISNYSGSGLLTTFLRTSPGAPTNFLDSITVGIKNYDLTGTLSANSTISLSVTKTNNSIAALTFTNNGYTAITDFAQAFVSAINTNSSFQSASGLFGADVGSDGGTGSFFDLQPQSQGYAAAQISATISVSTGLAILPSGANTLTDNVSDLRPRAHIYVSAGLTNLSFTNILATTSFSDGYHILTAVAYEGSHVRTQTRLTLPIVIKNKSLTATLSTALLGSTNSVQPNFQITVQGSSSNPISSIALYSTGGLLNTISNQNSATFIVNLTNLDIGLHPFYAIVTDSMGQSYRTQVQSVRFVGVNYLTNSLIGIDTAFPVTTSKSPVTLSWPATAGRTYNILATTNLLQPFQLLATVVPTNSIAQWSPTLTSSAQQFYRISTAP